MKRLLFYSTACLLLVVLTYSVQARTWTVGGTKEGESERVEANGQTVCVYTELSNNEFVRVERETFSRTNLEYVDSLLNSRPVVDEKHGASDAEHKAGDRLVKTIKGVEFAFRWCPAGTFMMGSPESETGRGDDENLHQVTLTKGFWMLETEVTQKQWKAVMGTNPSHFKGNNLPVEQISWNDCQRFCKKCTELGLPVCLPTEAQWEYACRANSAGPYAGNLDGMAWYQKNSYNMTHPVGAKKANAWGLYDMHGNVLEWCEDGYSSTYPTATVDPVEQPDDSLHVYRGGSWSNSAKSCRSANRCFSQVNRIDLLGIRVVLKVQ